jgi:hypothetical protein
MKTIPLSLLLLCANVGIAFGQQQQFSAEDETVNHVVALPAPVRTSLAQDSDVKELLEDDHLTESNLPDSWFLASEVDLAGSRDRQIIVVGRYRVSGANVTTFWIYRLRDGRYDLILKTIAHTVQIHKSRSHGYRDIEAVSATAVTVSSRILKFNGTRYQVSASRSEPIR